MSRVLVVLFSYTPWAATAVVLFFANTVALAALLFVPVPVLHLMGGFRVSPADSVLLGVAHAVLHFGCCTWFLWCVLAAGAWSRSQLRWRASDPAAANVSRPSLPLWGLALVSLGVWAVVLPFTQPEQQLRWRVERLFAEDRIAEALTETSAHRRSDFPPHWEPPPRQYFRSLSGTKHPLLKVCQEVVSQPTAGWVREIYLGKLQELLRSRRFDPFILVDLMLRLPEADALLREAGPTPEVFQLTKQEDPIQVLQQRLRILRQQDKGPGQR